MQSLKRWTEFLGGLLVRGNERTSSIQEGADLSIDGGRFGTCGVGVTMGRGIEVIGCAAGIHLGNNVRLDDGVRLVCADDESEIIIGDGTIIHARAILDTGPKGSLRLGRWNSVNPYCVLYGHGGLVAGDYVRIATHTVIIPANHVYANPAVPITKQGLTKQGIRIGSDVWIGSGCSILDGVEIGDGCVVGAGSVVNRNVLPFSIVAGVPARLVKMRSRDV